MERPIELSNLPDRYTEIWDRAALLIEQLDALKPRLAPLRDANLRAATNYDVGALTEAVQQEGRIRSDLLKVTSEFQDPKHWFKLNDEQRACAAGVGRKLSVAVYGESIVAKSEAETKQRTARRDAFKAELEEMPDDVLFDEFLKIVQRFDELRSTAELTRARADDSESVNSDKLNEAADRAEEREAFEDAVSDLLDERWEGIRRTRRWRGRSHGCEVSIAKVDWDPEALPQKPRLFLAVACLFLEGDAKSHYEGEKRLKEEMKRSFHLGKPVLLGDRVSFDDAVRFKQAAELLGVAIKIEEVPTRPAGPREPIPERVRSEVWRRDQGRCVDCSSRERLHFDHIIPVSKGGSNTARNLELRCESCNLRKGSRI
jgi:hypothetical protein